MDLYLPLDWFRDYCILFPGWVSNGHVLVRRDLIRNAYDFNEPHAVLWMDEDAVPRVREDNRDVEKLLATNLPSAQPFRVSRTQVTVEHLCYRGVYVVYGPDGSQGVLDCRYVDGLMIDRSCVWYSQGPTHPFFNAQTGEDVSLVVMPVEPDDYLKSSHENSAKKDA